MEGASTSAVMAISDVNRGQVYPPALRYHIDVTMNPNTFFETLQSFHTAMGTRFMNPVIGRQKLDLYQLYFLVTQRGGIEKAVLNGKWREVVAGLNISRTITNRLFVLKKHYLKLLYHYEQVYYFRRQGPIVVAPPDGIGHAASGDLPSDPALGVDAPNAAIGDAAFSYVALSPPLRENEPVGAQCFQSNMAAHGIRENMPAGERSMHNNLSNVNIGSNILHGVQRSQPLPAFPFSAPSASAAHPQSCRSGYSFFFEERVSMFRNLPSQNMGGLVRLIEESWGRLTEAERGVYTDRERMDRERHERELNEYRERIRRT